MDLKNIRVVLQIETSLREIFSKKVLTTPRDVPRYTSNQFPPIDTVFAQSSPLPSSTRYRTSAHPLEIPSAGPNRPFEKTIKSIQKVDPSKNPRPTLVILILEDGCNSRGEGWNEDDPFPRCKFVRRDIVSVQPLRGVDFEKCKNAPGFVFARDQIRKRRRLANWISHSRMAGCRARRGGGSPCLQHKWFFFSPLLRLSSFLFESRWWDAKNFSTLLEKIVKLS